MQFRCEFNVDCLFVVLFCLEDEDDQDPDDFDDDDDSEENGGKLRNK